MAKESPERLAKKNEAVKKRYDNKNVVFKKGHLAIIDEIAASCEMSTNAFILSAVAEKVARLVSDGHKVPSLPNNFLPEPNNVPGTGKRKSGED